VPQININVHSHNITNIIDAQHEAITFVLSTLIHITITSIGNVAWKHDDEFDRSRRNQFGLIKALPLKHNHGCIDYCLIKRNRRMSQKQGPHGSAQGVDCQTALRYCTPNYCIGPGTRYPVSDHPRTLRIGPRALPLS